MSLFALSSNDLPVTTSCHILCVMGDIATHLNTDTRDRIIGKFMWCARWGGLLSKYIPVLLLVTCQMYNSVLHAFVSVFL